MTVAVAKLIGRSAVDFLRARESSFEERKPEDNSKTSPDEEGCSPVTIDDPKVHLLSDTLFADLVISRFEPGEFSSVCVRTILHTFLNETKPVKTRKISLFLSTAQKANRIWRTYFSGFFHCHLDYLGDLRGETLTSEFIDSVCNGKRIKKEETKRAVAQAASLVFYIQQSKTPRVEVTIKSSSSVVRSYNLGRATVPIACTVLLLACAA